MNIAPAYVAEKRGNLQQMIEIFVSQQRYTADYIRQIEVFSADDGFEFYGWAQVNASKAICLELTVLYLCESGRHWPWILLAAG